MTTSRQDPIKSRFEEAMDLVQTGRTSKALSALFELFTLAPEHREGLKAAARLLVLLRDAAGADLLGKLAEDPEDPASLYKTGYHFISMGRPDVALAFLESCLRRAKGNADVKYELGYCHYLNHRYDRAVTLLREVIPELSPERSVAAEVLLIESLIYAGRADAGFERLKNAEEELRAWNRGETVDGLYLLFARYRAVDAEPPWDLRTWHFVKHGGILLAQSEKENGAGAFQGLSMNELAVGGLLRLLGAVLDGLSIRPEAILHLNGASSFILALALGSLLSRPVRHWEKRMGEEELLLAPDMESILRLGELPVLRETCAYLFCFQVFHLTNYPIAPDLVGLMTRKFLFPWEEQFLIFNQAGKATEARRMPESEEAPEILAGRIAEAARSLPEDSRVARLVAFFRRQRPLLECLNRERFPARRFFSPASPV